MTHLEPEQVIAGSNWRYFDQVMLSEKIASQLRALEIKARHSFQEDEIRRCLRFVADLQSDDYRHPMQKKNDHWYPNMRVRGVDARPVFQISEFGNVSHLEEVGFEISAEIRAAKEKADAELERDFADLSVGGKWENFNIKSGGKWNENAKQLLPITYEWLSKFPRLGELCFVSKCPSSNKMGHQSGLSIGGSGSFV